MSVEERLDRLEQRLEVLETLMRDVLSARGPVAASAQPPRAAPPPHPPPRPLDPPTAAAPAPTPAPARPRGSLASEEWIGQRGLLAIGVLALILAAGYLLKLSFERGWISPFLRCVGGVVAGGVVGAIGWRLLDRYRTYGASLIGCGAAIIYLAVWAASKLYGLVPPASGIGGLALVSLSLAAIAYGIGVQALGTTAALGAFIAPILLGRRGNPDALLIYLAAVGLALGFVAGRKRWRATAAVVALSFFGLGWAGAADSHHPLGALVYAIAGGTAGIYLGLRERWWETRFLAFWGGWALLATVHDRLTPTWPILIGGLLLAAPVWRHGLVSPGWRPLRLGGPTGEGWSLDEALLFFATPFLLAWAVTSVSPGLFDAEQGLAALVVAVLYLAAGYARPRPPFALAGAGALVIAVLQRWSGAEGPAILLGVTVLWAALDHPLGRSDGRWYAAASLAIALTRLLGALARDRGFDDGAFVGPWALTLWLGIGVTCGLAIGLWRRDPDTPAAGLARPALWVTAGLLALFGVTGEIRRFFRLRETSVETAQLAGGLAVSAWWLVFAAVLVMLGLRRRLRPVRLGGLAVAGLAVLKVMVFDLASLDALYRVGSVFILGLVSLLLAYLYHRQARAARVG